MIALGLMSGTSGDGVDAVALQLEAVDRPHLPRLLGHHHLPFAAELRAELTQPHRLGVRRLAELQVILADHYQRAVRQLPGWEQAQVCGMHGQTVWHQPNDPVARTTLQIGSSAALAQSLQLPVVADMRSADVALGGQGAPLVPFAHWFFRGQQQQPVLVVNLGGICNITYTHPRAEQVVGFDVGPGMVLSDAFALIASNGQLGFDQDGRLSAAGSLLPPLVEQILAHPFIGKKPPKSTGREDFGASYHQPLLQAYAHRHAAADISYSLLAATLAALQQACVQLLPLGRPPEHIILTGGGAHNPTLLAQARALFVGSRVEVRTDGVWAPQHHEPAAMALIAARTLHRLPSTLPQVTGASRASVCGHICYPS